MRAGGSFPSYREGLRQAPARSVLRGRHRGGVTELGDKCGHATPYALRWFPLTLVLATQPRPARSPRPSPLCGLPRGLCTCCPLG